MIQHDLNQVYHFLLHTPDQGLRKMLVDGKPFSESHLNLLLKIIRGCGEADFYNHFDQKSFPKIKFGPTETKIKEKFWDEAMATFKSRGLLTTPQKTVA